MRIVLREAQTLKVRMNHLVQPEVDLRVQTERSWTWAATDYAADESTQETFAIKFGKEAGAQEFKQEYEKAQAVNREALGGSAGADAPEKKAPEAKKEAAKAPEPKK